MLTEEYYGKREVISNNWQTLIENARLKGEIPPAHPGFPDYPTEAQIVQKAAELNSFVSQTTPTPEVKAKKSNS